MQIQVHTGSHTGAGSAALIETVAGMLQTTLGRFASHVTRVDAHLSDENGAKGGEDKRCVVEAHLEGRQPLVASDTAKTMKQAVRGAADKLVRMLDSTAGKANARRRDDVQPS